MQNKSRPNSRKKYWCKPPTPAVSWDRQSALGLERAGGGVSAEMGPTHRDRPTNSPSEETTDPRTPSSEGYKHQLSSVAVITTFHTVPVTKALLLWTHLEPCYFVSALGIFYPLGSQLPNCPCKHLYSSSTKKKHEDSVRTRNNFRCCGESVNDMKNQHDNGRNHSKTCLCTLPCFPETTTHKSI